jgi:hypothetical protein
MSVKWKLRQYIWNVLFTAALYPSWCRVLFNVVVPTVRVMWHRIITFVVNEDDGRKGSGRIEITILEIPWKE